MLSNKVRCAAVTAAFAAVLSAAVLSLHPGPAQTAFPGTNGKLAFDSTFDDAAQGQLTSNKKVYVMNPDGSGRTRLTHGAWDDWDPAWSPDGSKIVFASTRDDPDPVHCSDCNAEIYVMNADGSNQTRLTTDPDWDSTPSWSPDGAKIAFSSYRDGGFRKIFVMNADGSGQTSLNRYGGYPAWSPDGQKIAYGGGDIWVVSPDGSNPVNLTNSSGDDNETPSWSPDGTKIAYASWQPKGAVHVMNSDGSGSTQLTTPGYINFDEDPAWSPDGTKIVYAHYSGTTNIWVMNPDGTGKAALTACQVDTNARPDWQPLAASGSAATAAVPVANTSAASPCVPASPTPTVGPTPTPSPSAVPSPTASPTPTPGGQHPLKGDIDCDGGITSVDALFLLRYVSQLPVSLGPGCPAIDSAAAASVSAALARGDIDCDGSVTSVDALRLLRFVAVLPGDLDQSCQPIGT